MDKEVVVHTFNGVAKKVKVLVAQSSLTLCNPLDGSPPGSSAHGISQARTLECAAISSPGDLPDPGIEPRSAVLQADSFCLSHQGSPTALSQAPLGLNAGSPVY